MDLLEEQTVTVRGEQTQQYKDVGTMLAPTYHEGNCRENLAPFLLQNRVEMKNFINLNYLKPISIYKRENLKNT